MATPDGGVEDDMMYGRFWKRHLHLKAGWTVPTSSHSTRPNLSRHNICRFNYRPNIGKPMNLKKIYVIRRAWWRRGLKASLLFALLPLCLTTAKAGGTGFDCTKAHSAFERLACGEAVETTSGGGNILTDSEMKELAKLDEELNAVYKEAMAKHFDPALLRKEQRAWLKLRERCVQDDGCGTLSLYADRIDNLRYDLAHPPQSGAEKESARLLSMGSPPGDNFTFSRGAIFKGYGFGLCEALVRWFNHTTPKGDLVCEARLIRSMPGIVEPGWQELSISQHESLFVDVIRQEGPWHTQEWFQKYTRETRARGDKLWMVKENVYRLFDDKPETILWHQMITDQPRCVLDKGFTTIAFDDLHGVDKEAHRNTSGIGQMLLYYKGKPYFIGTGSNRVDASSPSLDCAIENFKHPRSQK